MIRRLKSAMRILLQGDARKLRRRPIPSITSSEVAEIKTFFPRDKFFMFGHARSGTTLLMRLVRLHPEVHCNYQAHFFTRKPLLSSLVDSPEAEEWLSRRSNRWNHGRDLSPLILRVAADFMLEREAASTGAHIVGDKSPSSGIHGQAVRDLHAIFPDAKLVYLVRDGRDVLISERFRNFVEESRFLKTEDRRIRERLRAAPESFADGEHSMFTESMIRRVAGGWSTDVSEIHSEGKRLFGKRYFALRYEDLLADPLEAMRSVWRFLGVSRITRSLAGRIGVEMKSNPDEEWQTRRGTDLASLFRKGRPGNWRNVFTERDKRVFKEVAGAMLIKWKYEKSNEW